LGGLCYYLIMKKIKKKIHPEYFDNVLSGKKKFDLRLNEFEVEEGDVLVLQEWDPESGEYTGREMEKKVVQVSRFKLADLHWPREEVEEKGLQIMSLE